MTLTQVSTNGVKDGSLLNADVNASAAIAGTKINPDFGSQNIVTTGTIASSDITIQNDNPKIVLLDTNNNDDFSIRGSSGMFRIRSETDAADRLVVNSDGHVDIGGRLDVGAGLNVEGATVFNDSGADVDFRIEGDTQSSLFKVDAGNNRIGVGESSPTVVFHATQFGHAFADSTSNLATVPTKSVARFRGSNNASGSLFIGNESTNARCYLQGCNETGNGSIDILLNPFGANVGIGTTSPSGKLDIQTGTNGNVLIDAEGGSVNHAKIVNDSGDLTLGARNTSADTKLTSQRHIHFLTGGSEVERMRIDSSGRVLIDTTSNFGTTLAKLQVNGSGIAAAVFNRSNNGVVIGFQRNGGSDVGTISLTASSTAYNTSSDYRLKENATAISDGITRLKTLKPYRFNFKVDKDTTVDGFFAHEVTAVPEAITGTKDEVDSDNKPIYQGIDQSKLVPLLTAALQEEISKREALETRVAALEAA